MRDAEERQGLKTLPYDCGDPGYPKAQTLEPAPPEPATPSGL